MNDTIGYSDETTHIETKSITNDTKTPHLDLGSILKTGRLRKGLSQITLAEQLGVNSSSISRWEKNQQVIAGDTLIQAAKILDITKQLFPAYSSQQERSEKRTIEKLEKKIAEIERKIGNGPHNQKLQIIVAESDYNLQITIQEAIFELPKRYHIINVHNDQEMVHVLNNKKNISLAIVSLSSSNINGQEILDKVEEMDDSIPKILIVDEGVKTKVLKGLHCYINRNFDLEEFLEVLQQVHLDWRHVSPNE